MSDLASWFRVRFDEWGVHRTASPPGGEAWADAFAWSDVVRVCFRAGGFLEPDEYYVFVGSRAQSFVVPMGAAGASEFADELYRRGLFPADLAIEAMVNEGAMTCWPKTDEVG